jgi:aminoglycoside phosphotransferase (APT) family kinase protein
LAGGKFSSVYAFELHPRPESWTGSFVLRLVGPAEHARLEAGLHVAAIAEGLSAPRLLFWEPDAPGLGGGYLVMEQIPGRTCLRGVEPWRFALDLPRILFAWPRQLLEVISALGRVDPAEAVSSLEHQGVADELARPGRHLRAVATALAGEPALAGAIDWLHTHQPPPPKRLALVHGDLWPGNVFVRGDEIQLIDWTRGGVDDPALDVGFAKVGFDLMPEPFPPPPPIRQLAHQAGSSVARRVSAHCDRLVGGSDRVRYYEAVRCAVELADVVVERSTGHRPGWEHGVPALVRRLEEITGRPIAFT